MLSEIVGEEESVPYTRPKKLLGITSMAGTRTSPALPRRGSPDPGDSEALPGTSIVAGFGILAAPLARLTVLPCNSPTGASELAAEDHPYRHAADGEDEC